MLINPALQLRHVRTAPLVAVALRNNGGASRLSSCTVCLFAGQELTTLCSQQFKNAGSLTFLNTGACGVATSPGVEHTAVTDFPE